MNITQQVDMDISVALFEDPEFLKLNEEERIKVLSKLNGMLHHTLYDVEKIPVDLMDYNLPITGALCRVEKRSRLWKELPIVAVVYACIGAIFYLFFL